jgi:hypothetical protein
MKKATGTLEATISYDSTCPNCENDNIHEFNFTDIKSVMQTKIVVECYWCDLEYIVEVK